MKVLLKKVVLIHPGHRFHNSSVNILISNGKLEKITKGNIKAESYKKIEGGYVSGGWFDIGTHAGSPGFEHRETSTSLIDSANAGGFTHVAPMPNLNPVSDNQTNIQFLKNQTQNQSIQICPIGSVTQGNKGTDIAELYDMHAAGAIGFSSGIKGITNAGVLLRSLEYVKAFNGIIINSPLDCNLNGNAQMHEGAINVQLGLQGSPSNFETIGLSRDLSIQQYAQSKLLVHLITTKESCALVKATKRKDKGVFASVSYQHLIETDKALLNFDPNYKVAPPLRSENDQKELIKAIKDSTIDIICTNHVPVEKELKHKEFTETKAGAIGLQTIFPLLNEHLNPSLQLEDWIPCLSLKPYKVLGLTPPKFESGADANITVFDDSARWVYNVSNNTSLSQNSPYIDREMVGKVKAIIYNKKIKTF